MNASSTLPARPRKDLNYSMDELIAQITKTDITRRADEDLFPTELGDELVRSSLEIARDGESFTVRARNGFTVRSIDPLVGTFRVERGDLVKFDRFLNPIGIR